MNAQLLCETQRLIDQGRYAEALAVANHATDGYWPDERYESAMANLSECLERVEIAKAQKRRAT